MLYLSIGVIEWPAHNILYIVSALGKVMYSTVHHTNVFTYSTIYIHKTNPLEFTIASF